MIARSFASASAFFLAVFLSSHAHMASALPTPQVTDLATLLTLTDDQLWDIFTQASTRALPRREKAGMHVT